jgi:uncharacterized protein
MDAQGISVQVLSFSGPGADLLPPAEGIRFARDSNDGLARHVAEHPARYAGFAHLPMTAPEAAADELERAVTELGFRGGMVNGTTEGRFLDAPECAPLLDRAARLGVPLYIHPHLPPAPVRAAYYDGLPGEAGFLLSMAGWGWHSETAVHVLRLVLSGALDARPGLRLIIGHMGEMLPVMLARADAVLGQASAHLRRGIAETILDHVHITTSGIFTLPPLLAAIMTFGVERILFSVDYPYSPNRLGAAFLAALPLSPEDRARIAHGNADRLLGLAV